MGLLNRLRPEPTTLRTPDRIIEPPKTALSVARTLSTQPNTIEVAKCPQCLDTSFWLPIGSNHPMCLVCSPPTSLSLVAKQYFFDDWGNVWRVDKNQNGSESYVRETFEPGSLDVYECGQWETH